MRSFKSSIASVASTTKHLDEKIVLDIFNVSDSSLLVTTVMIVITVKMTLQLLMLLLMKRIAWQRKKAKVVLLATVAIFGRAWTM
jgi:hypothetical protein